MRATLPILAVLALATAGCYESPRMSAVPPPEPRPVIAGSLFPADVARLDNAQVAQVLDGRIPLREHGRLAVLPVGFIPFLDAGFAETVRARIAERAAGNRLVGEVVLVPRMLLPGRIDVPSLREMGARMLCENVLLYTVSDDTRYDARLFAKDHLRVDLTVETVLVNVRTGCIPSATAADRHVDIAQVDDDHDRYEFVRRAQRECLLGGLDEACGRLSQMESVVR